MDAQPSIGNCCKVHWKGWLMVITVQGFALAILIKDCQSCRGTYLVIVMWISWLFELFPPSIVAMFPIIGFPLMNVMNSDMACSYCFRDPLLHLIIALMIGASLHITKLNLRIALMICKTFNSNVRMINGFYYLHGVLFALILPPTLTMAFMFPFTHSILNALHEVGAMKVYDSDEPFPFDRRLTRAAKGFYLSLAYGINIGGTASQIGSAVNVLFRDEYDNRFPDAEDKIEFGDHVKYALLPMNLCAIFVFVFMQYSFLGLFRSDDDVDPDIKRTDLERSAATLAIQVKLLELGPLTFAQALDAILLLTAICLSASREPQFTDGWGSNVSREPADTTVVTFIVTLMFALPGNLYFLRCWDERCLQPSPGLINWKVVNTYVSWSLIFIVGCAGTLAHGLRLCGVGRDFGEKMSNLKDYSSPVALLLMAISVMLITNFTINLAVMNVLAPGIIQAAIKSEVHPFYFGLPSAFIINIPFLLPQSSAPNALVCSYAKISVLDMVSAGIIPTLGTFLIVYIYALVAGPMFYEDIDKLPDWLNLTSVPNYGEK